MTRLPGLLVCFVVGSVVPACGGASISGSFTIHDELSDPTAVAACARGDVGNNLAVIHELRDSYHEMIVCGGLQLDFQSSLINVIANAALGRGQVSALRYQGAGVFGTPNGMMQIKTYGLDGVALAADAMDPNSYLMGLHVSANASGLAQAAINNRSPWGVLKQASASLDVQFSAAGPLVSLLELGPAGAGRLLLDPKKLARTIAKNIKISNRISVENHHGGTTVHYILESAPGPLSDLIDRKAVPMQLVSIVATHEATGQTVRVTDWAMEFKGDGGRVLDGSIGVEVDGGDFPYAAKFSYPHRAEPDIDLTCR